MNIRNNLKMIAILILIISALCGCSNSQDDQAVAITKKYITAIQRDYSNSNYNANVIKLQESKSFIINTGEDNNSTFSELYLSVHKKLTDINFMNLTFDDLEACDLNIDNGEIISRYNFTANSDTKKVSCNVTFTFKLIKKEDVWYINEIPKCDYDESELEKNLENIN